MAPTSAGWFNPRALLFCAKQLRLRGHTCAVLQGSSRFQLSASACSLPCPHHLPPAHSPIPCSLSLPSPPASASPLSHPLQPQPPHSPVPSIPHLLTLPCPPASASPLSCALRPPPAHCPAPSSLSLHPLPCPPAFARHRFAPCIGNTRITRCHPLWLQVGSHLSHVSVRCSRVPRLPCRCLRS